MSAQDQNSLHVEAMASVLAWLDELHSAAVDGSATVTLQVSERELVAYLRDVIYTAQETIRELQAQHRSSSPTLRVVPPTEKVG